MTNLDVSQALYAVDAAIAGRAAARDLPAPRTLDRDEWPPDYGTVLAWREQQLARFDAEPALLASARAYYSQMRPQAAVDFINHWCDVYDPRNIGKGKPVRTPFVLFRRQEELVRFYFACMAGEATGLVHKSRDMGATWSGISFSDWLWLFQTGIAVGWGSNHLEQVDKLGEPDTIFQKLRDQIRLLPACFRPPAVEGIHLKHGICVNPDNGAVVSGQGGKNIGRGGRRSIYFVDEADHLEHPEAAEAALSENTRCRIDMSTPRSPGTVFDRTRQAGVIWEPGKPVRRDVANVFVLDWRDHPEKTPEWYSERRRYFAAKGLPNVVAREIDHDPMGAAEGVIIKYEWVEAAVDAHLLLDLDDSGGWWGGLDVADTGPDTNALVRGCGITVRRAEEFGERDPGTTARRAFRACMDTSPILLQYDCIGLGTNVKSEFNRLDQDEGLDMSWFTLSAWAANGRVLNPADPVVKGDKTSPTNKNYFENFKAQAWWSVGQMFYRTWQAVNAHKRGGLEVEVGYVVFDEDGAELRYGVGELISISSEIPVPVRLKLMRELAQATAGQSGRLKLLVNKAPEGAKSPNLADALIMGRFPARPAFALHVGLTGPKVFVG